MFSVCRGKKCDIKQPKFEYGDIYKYKTDNSGFNKEQHNKNIKYNDFNGRIK